MRVRRGRLLAALVSLALALPVWASTGASVGAPSSAPHVGAAARGDATADLRLLSSPDFLNADVADLRRGPGSWTPRRSENGTNRSYEKAIDRILDDWVEEDPAAVLVAGDVVDGRWGRDEHHTGTFGPVRTRAQQEAALRRAAATYYPQWLERLREHDLEAYVAIGDHEYGDNDWPRTKRALAPVFAEQFARFFTTRPSGRPRFADRPRRGPHTMTSYAWRPDPDVQVVSIDVFDLSQRRARMRVDDAQLAWLRGVLKRARHDGVTWVVVQGHTPVLTPVRQAYTSGLVYEGGRRSPLWRLFRQYGVDVYLCGEVHAVTATVEDGIVQLAHGGAFQFGLTNYALLDFAGDRLDITVKDYRLQVRDAADGSRLWETVRDGMRKIATVRGEARVVGTLSLRDGGEVTERTGLLRPYRGSGRWTGPKA